MSTINVLEDTYIKSSVSDSNYNYDENIKARLDTPGGRIYFGLMKFNIPNVNISKATLRISTDSVTDGGSVEVFNTSNDWNSSSVTWNNYNFGLIGNSMGIIDLPEGLYEEWKEIDITALANANKGQTISFLISPRTEGVYVSFWSKEGTFPPEIVIEEGTTPNPAIPYIDDILLLPTSGVQGDSIKIYGMFKNTGETAATWNWNFDIEGHGGIHKPITLNPGQTLTDIQYFTIPSTMTKGMKAVSLYLSDVVRTFSNKLNVTTDPTPTEPAVPQINDVYLVPISGKVGDRIDIYATLKNIGGTAATWTWNLDIEGYGGTTRQITLNPGEEKEEDQYFTIPVGMTAGMKAVSIYLSDIVETFPNKLEVTEEAPPPEPAVPSIESLAISPTSGKVGDIISIMPQLKNTGGTSATWTWNFDVEGNGGTNKSLTLAPGETKQDGQYFTIPTGMTAGMKAVSIYFSDIVQIFSEKLEVTEEAPPPPGEYKILDPPPADFPAKFLPYYKDLDTALFNNDKEAVLAIMKAHWWEEGSLTLGAILAGLASVVGAIVAVIGSYGFSGFLFEEALQTLDMAIFQAQSNKQYDLAAIAIQKKQDFMDEGIWANIYGKIPFVNIIQAVQRFKEASQTKLTIDQMLLDRQIFNVSEPDPGDVVGWAQAYDVGAPTEVFDPKVTGILRVNVNAPGGTVVIDGLGYSSIFPFNIELEAGTHVVEVGAEGKVGQTKTVTLGGYEDKIEEFYLSSAPIPPPDDGKLTINSDPIGAKIYIDDEYKYEYTNTMILVSPGHHKLTLKINDYEDKSEEFDITANEEKTISMVLDPIGTPEPPPEPPPPTPPGPEEEIIIPLVQTEVDYNAWKITIKAIDGTTGEDVYAAILINDVYMNKYTPYYFYFQPEAIYNLKLRKQGYEQGEVTFTTKPLPT